MKLNINYFYVLVGQGSNYLFPILIYPFLIQKIGLNAFGYFSLSVIFTQFLLLVMDYGFGYSSASKLINLKDDQVSNYYSSVIYAKIQIFLLLIFIFIFTLFFLNYQLKVILFFSLLSCFFSVLNPLWYLQSTSNFKSLAILAISSKAITMLFLWCFIDDIKLNLAIFIFSLQYFFLSFLGFFVLKKIGISIKKIHFLESFDLLKDGSSFFFANLAASIYTIFTPIILGLSVTKTEIATYNAISVIKQGVAGFVTPLVQVIYSKMINSKIQLLDKKTFHQYISKRIFLIILFISLLSMSCVLFSKYIALYLFGYTDKDIIFAIQITALTPILIAFNSSFSTFCMLGLGMTKALFESVRFGAIICLLMSYPVSIYFGYNGIICLLFFTELLVAILMLFSYKKQIRVEV